MNPPDNSTEDIEKRLLDHTASRHALADSEERLLRLFCEQDRRYKRQRCVRSGLAAACLVFGFILCVAFQASSPASQTITQPEHPRSACPSPCESDEGIDKGIPEGTIDDIMRQALANAR